MDAKEKYLQIKKEHKNVFEILNELKKENNSIDFIEKFKKFVAENN